MVALVAPPGAAAAAPLPLSRPLRDGWCRQMELTGRCAALDVGDGRTIDAATVPGLRAVALLGGDARMVEAAPGATTDEDGDERLRPGALRLSLRPGVRYAVVALAVELDAAPPAWRRLLGPALSAVPGVPAGVVVVELYRGPRRDLEVAFGLVTTRPADAPGGTDPCAPAPGGDEETEDGDEADRHVPGVVGAVDLDGDGRPELVPTMFSAALSAGIAADRPAGALAPLPFDDEFECTWKDVQSTGRGARSLGVVRLDDAAPGFGVRDLDVRDGETVRLFAAGRETCRGDAHFDVYRLEPDGLVQLLDGFAVPLPGFPAPQRADCRWAAPATARRAIECLAFDDSLRLLRWDGEAGANVGAVDRFVLRYEGGRLVADPTPERVPVVCPPDETCRPRR